MSDAPQQPLTLQEQLGVFQALFLERLEGTLATFDEQLREPGAELPPDVLRHLHVQLHKLAGSGGTFGFPELSRQARVLEAQALAWLEAGAEISAPDRAAWISGVLGLRQSVKAGGGPQAGVAGRG